MGQSFLLVGLGNPGQQYINTRHNIGFMVLDNLAQKFQRAFTHKGEFFWSCEFLYLGNHVIAIKPDTYMNLSGLAVREAVEKYRIAFPHLLIIYDDLHLPFGKLRLRAKGSDGGHKGQASIIYHLQSQQFPRLRIGIESEISRENVVDFVLSSFDESEFKQLPALIERAASGCLSFVSNGISHTMNQLN